MKKGIGEKFKIFFAFGFIALLFSTAYLLFQNNNIIKEFNRDDLLNKSNCDKNIFDLNNVVTQKNKTIATWESKATNTAKMYSNYIDTQPEYVEFSSKNGKLKFHHRKDWICREVVNNYRVDCYSLARQVEEYSGGLDQPTVYFPELLILFQDCKLSSGKKNNESKPIKIVRPDVGTFYNFQRNFNCEVNVTSETGEINTEEKLNNIIYQAIYAIFSLTDSGDDYRASGEIFH